jgi:small-conductance mechanosensitive channel
MVNLTQFFQNILGTNALTAEIIASIVLFALVAFVGWGIWYVFDHYFSKWAEKTETTLDDDILAASKSFVVIIIVLIGINYAIAPLSFLQQYDAILSQVFTIIEILMIAFAVTRISNIFADWYGEKTSEPGKNRHHLIFIIKKVIQIFVFVIAFIIILWANGWLTTQNLTGATLGVGAAGIAVAFALQSTLTDFFSAFSIYYDRPFEIGDFIVVGNYSGTVKNIGMKSTRLKLLSGEELVLSNKELTAASVRNFRKLETRRIAFAIGVTYDTTLEKMKKIPPMIADIIKAVEGTEFERAYFTEFGDCSLKFEISYYVKSADLTTYLEIQQKINFAIKEAFEREAIEMAFPTSTVYVKK